MSDTTPPPRIVGPEVLNPLAASVLQGLTAAGLTDISVAIIVTDDTCVCCTSMAVLSGSEHGAAHLGEEMVVGGQLLRQQTGEIMDAAGDVDEHVTVGVGVDETGEAVMNFTHQSGRHGGEDG